MPRAAAAARAAATDGKPARANEGFARSRMGQIQRARLLGAMVDAACELGAANVTVANVVERAGVSRRTFYELFRDCEDCLLAAIADALERARETVLPAYRSAPKDWRARIRAGLSAALALFDAQPHLARLLIVEWLASGPRALERRRQVLEGMASAVEEGRRSRAGSTPPPELAGEAVVGSVVSVLHARLTPPEQSGRMLELLNPLMGIVVLPYMGAAQARRELTRPRPEPSVETAQDRSAPENPLEGLNIRVTYRTMRVLAAVGSHPGASNRVVAAVAGISDQGQISRLLMRLRRLGLVENNSVGRSVKGEANAWYLTVKGERVNALHGTSGTLVNGNTA